MTALSNEGLREIHTLLVPSKELPTVSKIEAEAETEIQQPKTESTTANTIATTTTKVEEQKESSVTSHDNDITTPPAEFIPSIFFSLHKIRKDPNNVSNQLETSTGFIRHRIKRCKTLISENEEVRSLLSHSTESWNTIIADREQELRVKGKVLQDLDSRISNILKTEEQTDST
ncbi:Mediator of RNA polymerase II transcription subunit 9 [Nakaseomyces bracarensis]|uniref:Mediator of RNA polymerase II transcription subunit 9 n=1 Tax=Nakaseomyces bracarensis TaxID=273131 RepID=A0ABR4NQN9_9SACH